MDASRFRYAAVSTIKLWYASQLKYIRVLAADDLSQTGHCLTNMSFPTPNADADIHKFHTRLKPVQALFTDFKKEKVAAIYLPQV
jgi:hypothetical protein